VYRPNLHLAFVNLGGFEEMAKIDVIGRARDLPAVPHLPYFAVAA